MKDVITVASRPSENRVHEEIKLGEPFVEKRKRAEKVFYDFLDKEEVDDFFAEGYNIEVDSGFAREVLAYCFSK